MYLSDMFAVAYKKGGREYVDTLFQILLELPDEWWEFRGCRNWLKVALRQFSENPEKFLSDLEKYSNSKEWLSGKPFLKPEDD